MGVVAVVQVASEDVGYVLLGLVMLAALAAAIGVACGMRGHPRTREWYALAAFFAVPAVTLGCSAAFT